MSNWHQLMPTPEAYWLDKVLFELHHNSDYLANYTKDPDGHLSHYRLTPETKSAIINNDVTALYLYGVNPYLLRAHCIGMRIPEAVSLAALRKAGENANG